MTSIRVSKSLFILLLAALPISAKGISITSDFFELYFSNMVEVQTFPVLGSTVEDIKLQLISGSGPKDQHGVHRYAVTKWNTKWNWPVNDKGEADFSKSTVYNEVRIILPRWDTSSSDQRNEVRQDELNRWQNLYVNLLNHELDHAKMSLQTTGFIKNELQQLSKSGVKNPHLGNQISKRLIAKNHSWDREYDQKTAHGKNQQID